MVIGKELATGNDDRATPSAVDGNIRWIAGQKGPAPVRIVAKLYGVVKSKVPVGYEDEDGFHFGANLAGQFFSI